MKLKTIKYLALGLVVAAGFVTVSNAQMTYDFVQGDYTTYPGENPSLPTPTASGTITLASGTYTPGVYSSADILSFSFQENPPGAPPDNAYSGSTFTVLSDGDLLLNGVFSGTGLDAAASIYQSLTGSIAPSLNENYVQDNGVLGGDWVAVPEPTTVIAGVLLLLPFGASTVRVLRKNRMA